MNTYLCGTIGLFLHDVEMGIVIYSPILSEHSAPFDAVVQVIEGEGHFIIGGKHHDLKEGQLIIMPANVPHAVKAEQKFKMLLVMLKAA